MAEEEGGASTATTNQQPGRAPPSLDPPPQQGRIRASYMGRSRQRHDVSHPSRLRVGGGGSVGRFRRCRTVLRAAVGVGAGREGDL